MASEDDNRHERLMELRRQKSYNGSGPPPDSPYDSAAFERHLRHAVARMADQPPGHAPEPEQGKAKAKRKPPTGEGRRRLLEALTQPPETPEN